MTVARSYVLPRSLHFASQRALRSGRDDPQKLQFTLLTRTVCRTFGRCVALAFMPASRVAPILTGRVDSADALGAGGFEGMIEEGLHRLDEVEGMGQRGVKVEGRFIVPARVDVIEVRVSQRTITVNLDATALLPRSGKDLLESRLKGGLLAGKQVEPDKGVEGHADPPGDRVLCLRIVLPSPSISKLEVWCWQARYSPPPPFVVRVPTALSIFRHPHPALMRWANLWRASGASDCDIAASGMENERSFALVNLIGPTGRASFDSEVSERREHRRCGIR